MGHKFYYQYKDYKGCPEATEISKTRSKDKSFVESIMGLVILGGIVLVIHEFGKSFLLGLRALAGFIVVLGIYMKLSSEYDKKTEKIISEVLKSYMTDIETIERIKEERESRKLAEQKKKAEYQSLKLELEEKRKHGETLEADQFIDLIEDADSMIDIWQIWQSFNFDDSYNEVRDYICEAKEIERVYGRSFVRVKEKKDRIRALLGREKVAESGNTHSEEKAVGGNTDSAEYGFTENENNGMEENNESDLLLKSHTLTHGHT